MGDVPCAKTIIDDQGNIGSATKNLRGASEGLWETQKAASDAFREMYDSLTPQQRKRIVANSVEACEWGDEMREWAEKIRKWDRKTHKLMLGIIEAHLYYTGSPYGDTPPEEDAPPTITEPQPG